MISGTDYHVDKCFKPASQNLLHQEDSEGDEENGPNVLKNNWVGGQVQLQLDLISRKEDVQFRCLKATLIKEVRAFWLGCRTEAALCEPDTK